MKGGTADEGALPHVDIYVAGAFLLRQMAAAEVEFSVLEHKVREELRRQPRPILEAMASACSGWGLPVHVRSGAVSVTLLEDLVRGRLVLIEIDTEPRTTLEMLASLAASPVRVLIATVDDATSGVNILDPDTGEPVSAIPMDRLLAVCGSRPLAWLATDAPAPPDTPGFATFAYQTGLDLKPAAGGGAVPSQTMSEPGGNLVKDRTPVPGGLDDHGWRNGAGRRLSR